MALRLVPASGTPIDVTKDHIVVGREPACEIVLSDGSVSRKHARIERDGESWKVIDNASANGTYVDGQRIAETTLRNGQELRFGAVAFKIEADEPKDELAETIIGNPFPAPSEATVLTPAVAPPRPAPPAPAPPPRAVDPDITESTPRPKIDEDPVTAYVPPAERTATPPQPLTPVPPPPAPAPPPRAVPPMPPPVAAPPPPPPPPRPAPPAPPPVPPRASAPPPPPPPPARPGMPPPAPRPVGAPPVGGPAPAAKKKGPLFWGVVGCCGCLLLLMLIAGIGGAAAWKMTSKPVEAIRATMQDAKGGNVDAAYGSMSSGFQQRVPKEAFAAFVAAHPAISGYTDSTFWQRNVSNNTAKVTGILTGAGGNTETAEFDLIEESGTWKIDNMTINGQSPSASDAVSSNAGGPGDAPAAASDGSGLALETTNVVKEPVANGVKVTVTINASGYATRPQGESYLIHLVEDLETFAPGGARIDGLSKEQIQAINNKVESAAGGVQQFVTDITLLEPPDGEYRARITIHDMIGGGAQTEEVSFSLP